MGLSRNARSEIEQRFRSGYIAPGVDELRQAVDARLDQLVPLDCRADGDLSGQRLTVAMRYGLLAPGKRVRPLLTLLTAKRFGRSGRDVVDSACAIEMVHTASLVLDDLPCMDGGTTRRGRPTLHRQFGESTAILVAVALLNRAYQVLGSLEDTDATVQAELVRVLGRAVGTEGLVGGQEADLTADVACSDLGTVEAGHIRKTSALFVAAVDCGACLAGVRGPERDALGAFATSLGLAFQALDDVRDATGAAAILGKDVRQDIGKCSVVAVLGQSGAREAVDRHVRSALEALDGVSRPSDVLRSYVAQTFGAAMDGV